jgi:hypothetical protein
VSPVAKPDSWEALLAGHSPDVAETARAVEAVLREAMPEAVVRFDPGNRLLAVGRDMSMRGLLFAVIPHASWVNLQLADGALLPDPDGLVEGTGKRIRHVKVRSPEMAREARLVALVRAQIEARRQPA